MSQFVHLRVPTEFSIKKSINTVDKIVSKAQEDGQKSLAITDLNAMFGTISFCQETQKSGIKPIIGAEITVSEEFSTPSEDPEKEDVIHTEKYNIVLLAKDEIGYAYISNLVSRAYTENNNSQGEIAVRKEWILDNEENDHVVMLSGAKDGDIGRAILADNMNLAYENAQIWKKQFKDFYIELQRDASSDESTYMQGALDVASKLGIAPVATHPNLFTEKEGFFAHEIKTCIDSGQEVNDRKRKRIYNKEQYFKTAEEMQELFSDLQVALDNTSEIAKKCNYTAANITPKLPIFETDEGKDIVTHFKDEVVAGLKRRLIKQYKTREKIEEVKKQYLDRIKYEVKIINEMGFPSYFLVVADIINWCRENDIPVGPGRGSAAGSLVAYCLGICDLDPLKYNLLFERFLNPERVSMPDVDTDISSEQRQKVLNYIEKKYGSDKVAQIVTFNTLAAKAVVKDTGRVLGLPFNYMNDVSKLIKSDPNTKVYLDEQLEINEGLKEKYESDKNIKKVLDVAIQLEGLTKATGVHAGGVIIAPSRLTNYTPLYKKDDSSVVVTQFDKDQIESTGLIKYDFLGLSTLDVIHHAVQLVNQRPEFEDNAFDITNLETNDALVYENILSKGNNVGIFQFESSLMSGLLKKSNQSKFENLIIVTSLGRPGPIQYADQWLDRLHGREKVEYPHPKLEGILAETQGIMIYQEQVMQTAQVIAGYSLGQADLLRRAMGKKKIEEMVKQRAKFVTGAREHSGVDENTANEIFDTMEKFAGYGFNKSHAAVYSYLSYQMAYLKHYYPAEFYTATLNNALDDTDNINKFLTDMGTNDIKMLAPDINKSSYLFTVDETGEIRYALGAIKGAGEQVINLIEKAREEKGEFTDFFDFLEKVGKGLRRNVLQALVQAGAFDSIHANRAQLYESIDDALKYVSKYVEKQQSEKGPLEEMYVLQSAKRKKKDDAPLVRPELVQIDDWEKRVRLSNEKNSLGVYFSENPFNGYKEALGGLNCTLPLSEVQKAYNDGVKYVALAGVVREIKWWKSNSGGEFTITDGTKEEKVMFYASTMTQFKGVIEEEKFVLVNGRLGEHFNGESHSININSIHSFEEAKVLLAQKVFVAAETEEDLQKFESIAEFHKPQGREKTVSVIFSVANPDTGRRNRKLQEIDLVYSEKLISELSQTFGSQWIKERFSDSDRVEFPKTASAPKKKFTKK
jgi:DNA polymerase III subunit alpha